MFSSTDFDVVPGVGRDSGRTCVTCYPTRARRAGAPEGWVGADKFYSCSKLICLGYALYAVSRLLYPLQGIVHRSGHRFVSCDLKIFKMLMFKDGIAFEIVNKLNPIKFTLNLICGGSNAGV